MPTYRFTGESSEIFPFLPADPPARVMEPGDTVECSEEVEHPRLEIVSGKSRKSADPTPDPAAAESASPTEEAN